MTQTSGRNEEYDDDIDGAHCMARVRGNYPNFSRPGPCCSERDAAKAGGQLTGALRGY